MLNGKDYHYLIIDCDCETNQLCVADEIGEDCNAYNKKEELKGVCEICNKTLAINIVKQ